MSAASFKREASQPHAIAEYPIILCPSCGSHDYRSNLMDDGPCAYVALEASYWRHFGHPKAAAYVKAEEMAVRIENFVRLRWRCNNCAAQFDE